MTQQRKHGCCWCRPPASICRSEWDFSAFAQRWLTVDQCVSISILHLSCFIWCRAQSLSLTPPPSHIPSQTASNSSPPSVISLCFVLYLFFSATSLWLLFSLSDFSYICKTEMKPVLPKQQYKSIKTCSSLRKELKSTNYHALRSEQSPTIARLPTNQSIHHSISPSIFIHIKLRHKQINQYCESRSH